MSAIEHIKKKLEILKPHFLEVIDDSNSHLEHLDVVPDNVPSHLIIKIGAESLKTLSRVERHQQINELLKEEFKKGLHALSIKIVD